MTNIDLNDIYAKIENNASFDFSDILKDLRFMLNTVDSEDTLKKVKCEINCLNFQKRTG